MLVVKIELWPGGRREEAGQIARINIANDGAGTVAVGSYDVAINFRGMARRARVENFQRGDGALALVRAALEALGATDGR